MIKVSIPDNNIKERTYIISIFFREFLKLEYTLAVGSENYEISLENEHKLVIEDHFFSKYPKDLDYLKIENIPRTIDSMINDFIIEGDIPVIYGNSTLERTSSLVICGIDIFASSFFMLTRWEEYVNRDRDNHERFESENSLGGKCGFLNRPIVNEYLEMLKNMLLSLDSTIIFSSRSPQLYLTHDIDYIYKWDSPTKFFKSLVGDIIIRKSIKEFLHTIILYLKVKVNIQKDPYDTFDYLMDMSEKAGVKSYFFFMAKGLTPYDNRYKSNSLVLQNLIQKIKDREHFIGIHPSYNSFNSMQQFKMEKNELEENFHTEIKFGRQHYLRFEIPDTWQIWEDNKMEWDSTLSYSDHEGFRCGVCYEYSVFNIKTQKNLMLKERPLIVMDMSLLGYQKLDDEMIIQRLDTYMNIIKKYRGDFVLLWHNSSFKIDQHNLKYIYQHVIEYYS